ncbi:hypothetical protein DFA_10700 [Cavenderia fasciculata]|uniref:Uncharacterized protein n=1 Tax=Cavenderia fasciculata TaxID=261658 RepID=F4QB55_CACFS|nr:uncharacterized protein DFA_10700 [Cavenderia fasciculata]EGG14827.1 hypothetical protein DFA_10700 [Cavenderia fasciculata]|eukprot:XP_004351343.1 hypothetical protein DFA_10700 [Cavenderia fasciculata]
MSTTTTTNQTSSSSLVKVGVEGKKLEYELFKLVFDNRYLSRCIFNQVGGIHRTLSLNSMLFSSYGVPYQTHVDSRSAVWSVLSGDQDRIKYLEAIGYKHGPRKYNPANRISFNFPSSTTTTLTTTAAAVNKQQPEFTFQSLIWRGYSDWIDDEGESAEIMDKLYQLYTPTILKKYNSQLQDYFHSKLKEMIDQYNINLKRQQQQQQKNNSNNNKETKEETKVEKWEDNPNPSNWFTKKELNLLFIYFVALEEDIGLKNAFTASTVKLLLHGNSPIVITYFVSNTTPRNLTMMNFIFNISSQINLELFNYALDSFKEFYDTDTIRRTLHHMLVESIGAGEYVSTRNILACGRLPLIDYSTQSSVLNPFLLDHYVAIGNDFFRRPEHNITKVNQRYWLDIYKCAALSLRNDVMESFFSIPVITDPNDVATILKYAIQGANYLMALRIRDRNLISERYARDVFTSFVKQIPILCSNRVDAAIDFAWTWEDGLVLDTWSTVVQVAISNQRLDVLLKLKEHEILDSDFQIYVKPMVIKHTIFLLECMEALPANCFSSEDLSVQTWKSIIRKAKVKHVLDQVGKVIERYFDLEIHKCEYTKYQVKSFLSRSYIGSSYKYYADEKY